MKRREVIERLEKVIERLQLYSNDIEISSVCINLDNETNQIEIGWKDKK